MAIVRIDTFRAYCDGCGKGETFTRETNPDIKANVYGKLPPKWDVVKLPRTPDPAYVALTTERFVSKLLCPTCIAKL